MKKIKIETMGRVVVAPYKTGVNNGFGLDITIPYLGLRLQVRIQGQKIRSLKVSGTRQGGDTITAVVVPYDGYGYALQGAEVVTDFRDPSDRAAGGYMSYQSHTPTRFRVRVSGYPRDILVRISSDGQAVSVDGHAGDASEFSVRWAFI